MRQQRRSLPSELILEDHDQLRTISLCMIRLRGGSRLESREQVGFFWRRRRLMRLKLRRWCAVVERMDSWVEEERVVVSDAAE